MEMTHKIAWTWLRRGSLKRETESLLIAARNNPKSPIISK